MMSVFMFVIGVVLFAAGFVSAMMFDDGEMPAGFGYAFLGFCLICVLIFIGTKV